MRAVVTLCAIGLSEWRLLTPSEVSAPTNEETSRWHLFPTFHRTNPGATQPAR